MKKETKIRKIAFLGDYLPRRCGIATFTTDLLTAVAFERPQTECFSVSVNDTSDGYEYPDEVRFEIEEQDVAAAYFTMTPDLNACFPAAAARQLGWNNTALMGASEVAVPGSLDKCIRVLILLNTDKKPADLVNLYLNGTAALRLQGVEST